MPTMALLGQETGLDGAVCSPKVEQLRQTCGDDFLCPGIRPSWATAGDQARSLTQCKRLKLGQITSSSGVRLLPPQPRVSLGENL